MVSYMFDLLIFVFSLPVKSDFWAPVDDGLRLGQNRSVATKK